MDELSGHLTELGGAGGDGERNEVEGNDVELVSPCAGYVRWSGRDTLGWVEPVGSRAHGGGAM